MSTNCKRSILCIKDKSSIIFQLEKGTNLSTKHVVSKQQMSHIHKNKDKIIKLRQVSLIFIVHIIWTLPYPRPFSPIPMSLDNQGLTLMRITNLFFNVVGQLRIRKDKKSRIPVIIILSFLFQMSSH